MSGQMTATTTSPTCSRILYSIFETHDRHAALHDRHQGQRQANTRTVSDDAEAQILDPKLVMGYLASRPSVSRAAIHINVIIHY